MQYPCKDLEKFIRENKDYLTGLIKQTAFDGLEHGVAIERDKDKFVFTHECKGNDCQIDKPSITSNTIGFFHTHPGKWNSNEATPKTPFHLMI